MQQMRCNAHYLNGIAFPDSLQIACGNFAEKAMHADLIIVATPLSALRGMLTELAHIQQQKSPEADTPVVWLCKGVEPASEVNGHINLLPHEVQKQVAPLLKTGVLSGPSFAQEVGHDKPTALVAASEHAHVTERLIQAFHSGNLRIYSNDDVIGVELGGAIKNVLAIATGFSDGLDLGLNARAALITRGLAEMTRLGKALGANPETFMGLTGVGDLVLTATGNLSRNRQVGLLLAKGMNLQEVLQSLGHVAEGVHCTRAVVQRAQSVNVEMPFSQAVLQLLEGQVRPEQIVHELLARIPAQE